MHSGLYYRASCTVGAIILFLAGVGVSAAETGEAAAKVDFAHAIVPILKSHCVECHGGRQHKGDFSINTRESILQADAVEPGKAADSELIDLVTSDDPDERMPKGKPPLAAAEIKSLRDWIDGGMSWEAGFTFAARDYEPPLRPRRPELPPVVDGRSNAVDRILDAYLQKHKVPRPAPLDDAAFLRRVYLDLVGLLPTPDTLQAFVASKDPAKRQQVIDELLANKYGYAEHWLSFWNDLLRNDYAGTGYIDGGRESISALAVPCAGRGHAIRRVCARTDCAHEGIGGFHQGD